MFRKCGVCKGRGVLWGTPKLTEEGGLAQVDRGPQSDLEYSRNFGTDLKCWKCLGRGSVPDDTRDEGDN